MYRMLVGIVLATASWFAISAAEPYCIVTTYGYKDGVPSSTGSRALQDHNGFIWIATWNGLYRFDGHEFRQIRTLPDDDVRKYSSRFRDIKMGPDSKMWCRIDDNIVLFDVDTHDFYDLHSRIEEKLGKKLKINNAIRETTDGDVVLNTADGHLLKFESHMLENGEDPIDAIRILSKEDAIKLKSAAFFKTPLPPSFSREETAYSKKDEHGHLWCITKDGKIMTGSHPEDTFLVKASVDVGGSPIKFSCEDDQGNVWMISNGGIHKISLGTSPLTYITPPEKSQLRASMTDRQQRIWMSWSDSEYVSVHERVDSNPHYLRRDGTFSNTPERFGSPIYSMAASSGGEIWLGSKPDGLFRLTPRKEESGYIVNHITRASMNNISSGDPTRQYDNYYDMAFDKRGRLWLASLGNGIEVIEDPSSPNPQIIPLIECKTYPQEADKVRRLRIIGDSLIIATTTEGLLSFTMPDNPATDKIAFNLHRSTPGDIHSLGNIATMDAMAGSDGRIYVATESDGLNILISPLTTDSNAEWKFTKSHSDHPAMAETTLTIGELPDGQIIVVGKKDINLMHLEGYDAPEVLGTALWKKDLTFKEVSPLRLPDGRWLIGLSDGAVAVDLEKGLTHEDSFPIEFTSCNIEGGLSITLSPNDTIITLQPKERAMTLSFAALCYSDATSVRYAYRLDDSDDWIPIGALRTLTFTRLQPGIHTVSVKSTDMTGRWLDNASTITIDVKPTFWETGWAKLLYAAAILSLIGVVGRTIIYMRRIKRKQRETLEAYLSLLEARTTATYEAKEELKTDHEDEENPMSITQTPKDTDTEINVKISSEDKELISKVVDFIDQNFTDCSITVDDMAKALTISKSSLTKKMKSLMGVTPADFLKTTRLSKAKIMLKETRSPIKEIAIDCGFSDMNYFGKCFKAAFGVTPGNYRKESTTT